MKAHILCISIEECGAQYQCGWFAEGKRQTAYFRAFEIESKGEVAEMKIGYKKGK